MGSIAIAAAIMGGLGLVLGSGLALAYRFLRVEEDPRLEQVEAMLPGTNCGACGEPGCHGFAMGLSEGRRIPSGCTVADATTVEQIAEFLGVEAGSADKLVARLKCAGGRSHALQIAEYQGHGTCRAAAVVSQGGKGCAWGCLGLGDCDRVCDFDAIHMNAEGLPVVDVQKCTACKDCVDVCPRDLFDLVPLRHRLLVQCNIPLAGDEARALCKVTCDACGRCVQDAPEGLIEMRNNLPYIHYDSGIPLTAKPTLRCPTGAIQWVVGDQLKEQDPHESGVNRYV